uniref:ANTAR domain-containing protein n=1 Tax=Echinostoma caproni TaxID=27848 RepID=A0A183APC9_9TREM
LTTRLAPYLSRRQANELIQAARMLISERADALRSEATELLAGVHPRSTMSQLAEDLQFRQSSRSNPTVSMHPTNSDGMSSPNSTPIEDEDLFA